MDKMRRLSQATINQIIRQKKKRSIAFLTKIFGVDGITIYQENFKKENGPIVQEQNYNWKGEIYSGTIRPNDEEIKFLSGNILKSF